MPEVTQSGTGGARVEARATQRDRLCGDGCPGPGRRVPARGASAVLAPQHRGLANTQEPAPGLRVNGDSPCTRGAHGLADPKPWAKPTTLTSALAQSLFHNVPAMGKSEEMTSAGMLTVWAELPAFWGLDTIKSFPTLVNRELECG